MLDTHVGQIDSEVKNTPSASESRLLRHVLRPAVAALTSCEHCWSGPSQSNCGSGPAPVLQKHDSSGSEPRPAMLANTVPNFVMSQPVGVVSDRLQYLLRPMRPCSDGCSPIRKLHDCSIAEYCSNRAEHSGVHTPPSANVAHVA